MRAQCFVLLSLCVTVGAARAQNAAKPSTLTWGPAPAVFPAGAKMAVVSGDPSKPGPFTVQLAFPDGYKIQPHTHPTDEKVTVVNGTFVVGMGSAWDGSKMKPMAVGASGTMPAGTAHFAEAKGKTDVQVTSMGPFAMTYINPADDPSGQHAP